MNTWFSFNIANYDSINRRDFSFFFYDGVCDLYLEPDWFRLDCPCWEDGLLGACDCIGRIIKIVVSFDQGRYNTSGHFFY